MHNLDLIRDLYSTLPQRIAAVRKAQNSPLTLSEKVLYSHLFDPNSARKFERGVEYVDFKPDRVAMQDATAQMALLQFMNSGRDVSAVPTSIHCDHLIEAKCGAKEDIATANSSNREVYDFLKSVAQRYSLGFWQAGAGIIHQVVLENYAFPGGMMVGTDSHTPNAGGVGMIAIGVGGADAVDVMAGIPWELKMPKIIGVKLTGKLNGWSSPKDIILCLAGILTVKGGTNAIIEYFGDGAESLSATGKATICNMGAEVGATTSIFPYDDSISRYLCATEREEVAKMAHDIADCLRADKEVYENPEKYYDRLIEINISCLEPYINGPFTPDAAHTVSEFAELVRKNGYPQKMEVGLIGSCTNSSYQDLGRAASVARQAKEKGLEFRAQLLINPGSEQVRYTAQRDGILTQLVDMGGVVMANACGPCIGQWARNMEDNARPNSIVTSFNRNFAKRADGNPNTHAFVASPEIVTALTIAGDLTFNPLTDTLLNDKGESVMLDAPCGDELPMNGFEVKNSGYIAPMNGAKAEVQIAPDSQRLQRLERFAPWCGNDLIGLRLLIKAEGKCTTDHISMAGPWLRFRGHLENISDNLLMGAVNKFNGRTASILNPLDDSYDGIAAVAKRYKSQGISSIVVAEDNYGEGSSREHAALEPRFLGVKVVLVKSFARIHETNLKKQGLLALTFINPNDYDLIRENDSFDITGLKDFAPGGTLTITLRHSDGSSESFEANHTYNAQQIEWFKAGAALNC